MRKLFLCILLCISSRLIYAQENVKANYGSGVSGKNLLKINLLSLPLGNFSFEYERVVANKITVGMGYRFMPKSGIPLKSTISNLIDDPDTEAQLDQFKTSNSAITPELRFYLGKEALRGFYLGPFVRISNYKLDGPFEYDVNNNPETLPLVGKLNTVTGGLLIGAQWKLGGGIYLDWWTLGPQYGSANGSLTAKQSLSQAQQDELRPELEALEIPFAETKTTVNAQGARVDITGPWAGLRAGLCLGLRF
ncbi:MAG: DUF3575 domain-containing protein [Bacteroidota bacterium]